MITNYRGIARQEKLPPASSQHAAASIISINAIKCLDQISDVCKLKSELNKQIISNKQNG